MNFLQNTHKRPFCEEIRIIWRRFSMEIGTLRKFLCTLSVGLALLLGMSLQVEAQRGHPPSHAPAWGVRNARPYGQQVSARRHRRNSLRHDLSRHQRFERRTLRNRLHTERAINGNSPAWRTGQREERAALRTHQREERDALKQSWKNNKRHR